MLRWARFLAGFGLAAITAGCDDVETRPFDLGDGTVLALLDMEPKTKSVANGREVGYLEAVFMKPADLTDPQRRPLAEKICPRVLEEMGAPEDIDGAKLETVLIKFHVTKTFLGIEYGSDQNFWVELSRGDCVSQY